MVEEKMISLFGFISPTLITSHKASCAKSDRIFCVEKKMISLSRFTSLTLITSHKTSYGKSGGIFCGLGIVLQINYYLFIWTVCFVHNMREIASCGCVCQTGCLWTSLPFLSKVIYLMD